MLQASSAQLSPAPLLAAQGGPPRDSEPESEGAGPPQSALELLAQLDPETAGVRLATPAEMPTLAQLEVLRNYMGDAAIMGTTWEMLQL